MFIRAKVKLTGLLASFYFIFLNKGKKLAFLYTKYTIDYIFIIKGKNYENIKIIKIMKIMKGEKKSLRL